MPPLMVKQELVLLRTYCILCHHEIEPNFAFCPACGADNRDPHNLLPVHAHAHDFQGLNFCVQCGQHVGLVVKPKLGFKYSTFPRKAAALGLALAYLPAILFGTIKGAKHAVIAFTPFSAGLLLAYIMIGLYLLWNMRQTTLVDLLAGEVRVLRGYFRSRKVERYALSAISGVLVRRYRRYDHVRGRPMHLFSVDLQAMGGQALIPIVLEVTEDRAYAVANDLSQALGKVVTQIDD